MMKFQRQVVREGFETSFERRGMWWRGPWWRRWLVFAMVSVGGGGAASAQAPITAGRDVSAFVDGGIQNVQYPSYADNALGGNVGAFVQPKLLVGVEVRGGWFPVGAKYTQLQTVAGWRFGLPPGPRVHMWMPYVFGGGGYSRAQDLDGKGQAVSNWDPCWQTSVGVDRRLGNLSVRLVELSYRRTYTPFRTLRSLEATTGLVYRF